MTKCATTPNGIQFSINDLCRWFMFFGRTQHGEIYIGDVANWRQLENEGYVEISPTEHGDDQYRVCLTTDGKEALSRMIFLQKL